MLAVLFDEFLWQLTDVRNEHGLHIFQRNIIWSGDMLTYLEIDILAYFFRLAQGKARTQSPYLWF